MAQDLPAPARIAFIGLGRMGRGMALNLCRKGFALVVHDIDPRPVQDLVAAGASAAGSIAPPPSTVSSMLHVSTSASASSASASASPSPTPSSSLTGSYREGDEHEEEASKKTSAS